MNKILLRSTGLASFLALATAAFSIPASAEVVMNGEVTFDYYVSDTDAEGFEQVSSDFYVEQIDNTGDRTGPLSLSGWATTGSNPAGSGDEIGYSPIGPAPANSVLNDYADTAPADDLPPGEYYAHVLLQDDSIPGTFEDARTMSPKMLWRGGLEAVGPLKLYPYDFGRSVDVEFGELRNNRTDSRYTNDVLYTLYATYGYGPASQGYTLCTARVRGLYAGTSRYNEGFSCSIADLPNGDYTLHLEVAEVGGRGGYSTLSGPDQRFYDGAFDDGYVVYAAALSPAEISVLLVGATLVAWRRRGAIRVRA